MSLWKPVETIRPQAPDPIRVSMPRLEGRSMLRSQMPRLEGRSVLPSQILPSRPWNIVATGNFSMVDGNDEYFGSNGKYPQYRLFYNGGFTDLLFYDRQSGSLQFYLKEPAETTPQESLCGYASARSVLPGDAIQFHVSSQVGTYRIDIYRQALQRVFMANVQVSGPAQPYPISRTAYRDGAGWPAAASFTIPMQWPSGLYLAHVYSETSGVTYDIPFVVRPVSPGAQARILLAAADTTYEAYNFWGGRSLYGHGSSGLTNDGESYIEHIWSSPYADWLLPRALSLSFLRPFASAVGYTRMQTFEVPLIQWLERNRFSVDVCAASDLDQHGDMLLNYQMFVSVGHDEYWSEGMRDAAEKFIENGGNAAFLSGNTCYWAIRLSLDGNSMICCKDKKLDPDTILWKDTGRSAVSMVGTDDYNVWPNVPPDKPVPGQYFVVKDKSHWVFDGTFLNNDDTFGVYLRSDGIFVCVVGGETNDFGTTGVLATATFIDTSDNNRAYVGTMLSFKKGEHGGTVFNAASINWVTGLSQQEGLWNTADQITWNVFNRLSPSQRELVAVPDVFEMSATAAADLIRTAEMVPKFVGDNHTHSWVSKQSPVAGQLAAKGSTVTLTLSTGPMP
jgi:hypothetical protein